MNELRDERAASIPFGHSQGLRATIAPLDGDRREQPEIIQRQDPREPRHEVAPDGEPTSLHRPLDREVNAVPAEHEEPEDVIRPRAEDPENDGVDRASASSRRRPYAPPTRSPPNAPSPPVRRRRPGRRRSSRGARGARGVRIDFGAIAMMSSSVIASRVLPIGRPLLPRNASRSPSAGRAFDRRHARAAQLVHGPDNPRTGMTVKPQL